jgi:ABC-2 type transport system ATP-binding protein
VDLTHRREDMVDDLSRGMKQRLSLARTLLHDPQVLILDEPASGLDPRARVEIRELLVELSNMGKTVFFSTHILADVAEICSQIGIIEAGRLIASGPIADLAHDLVSQRRVCIKILNGSERAAMMLQGQSGVDGVQTAADEGGGSHQVKFWYQGDDPSLSKLLAKLIQEGIEVVQFTEETDDLEDVFLRVTKGIVS